ncbi:pseudouridine synthase [Sphingomonas sp. MMS24-JH45]
MIAEGRVAKDGATIDTPATLLPSLHGGSPSTATRCRRLPRRGCSCSTSPPASLPPRADPGGQPDDLRPPAARPATARSRGRLDLNTEGLLLMTTDGELKQQLELPSTGVERAYRARAYGPVTQEQLEDLIEGVEIEGVRYGSIDDLGGRRTGANVWIEMILTEGENREVRRVLEYLGLRVGRLIRTRYGPLSPGSLPWAISARCVPPTWPPSGRCWRRAAARRAGASRSRWRQRRRAPPPARAAAPNGASDRSRAGRAARAPGRIE